MFDEVTKKEGGKQAARRATYVLGSTVFQGVIIAALVTASAYIKAEVIDEPKTVDVKFVKTAPPPPPPPPAPPPPAARKRPPDQKPRTDLPKPPPPQALIQPQEIQAEMKPPDPNEPPEPEYDYGDAAEGEGVIGGVVGAQAQPSIEDAPAFATAGFRKPEMVVPRCVQNAIRLPPALQGFVSGPVTIKFAVNRDASVGRFEVLTPVPQQIADAIWRGVQSCKFTPGTDPQGRATAIWVIMPIRFAN